MVPLSTGIVPTVFRVAKHANRRIPKLRFTKLRDIGWHVSYRDATSGMPRKHRFGMVAEAEARRLYQRWLVAHLGGEALPPIRPVAAAPDNGLENEGVNRTVVPGSILHVATGLLNFERSRARLDGQARARGTIAGDVYRDRTKHVRDFLKFLNGRHEPGIVSRMRISELDMQDVEAFNRHLVDAGYSASQVAKRLQVVKAIIDRAGRPEHGSQMLRWNWDSRDVVHGKPPTKRDLPTLEQLDAVLKASDLRERAMVWMGIGLGFGQLDLGSVRVGQIDGEGYDLRRGKTAIERFGKTPPLVWAYIQAYLKENPRADGELMFVTRRGLSLVHERGDSVQQWWHKLRKSLNESKDTLGGFYILRHLGATVFGSNPGCSIAEMRRWLGHAASSRVADVYMRPVPPENRKVVEWVRKRLSSTKLD